MCGQNPTSRKLPASRSALAVGAVALMALLSTPLQAQIVLEEIIVTAQKREQSLEDVPASVSAITGDTVREFLGSAENIRALTNRVPSLNVESSNGRTQPRFYIRGQGNIDFDNNANQPVSMVYDEIALENNVLRSVPVFDIERIEVLRGAQGSLFGRNTNAGVVKIDSVKPSFDSNGYIALSGGSRDTYGIEAAAGGQLGSTSAGRLSIKYQERDNWIDNTVNGEGNDFGAFDEFAVKLQFLFEPNDDFTGLVKLHGFRQEGTQPQVFYSNAIELGTSGVRSGFNEEIASHDGPSTMDLTHRGIAANLKWDFGNTSLTSITGYDKIKNFQSADVDGGELSFDVNDIGMLGKQVFFSVATGDGLSDHHQFTQEIRISGENERLFWQGGFYYFDEEIDVLSRDFELAFSDITNQTTRSSAIFAQVDYGFSDRFSVILGGRFTRDDKRLEVIPGPTSFSPADVIEVDDSYFSWDLAFTYDLSDSWNIYGRAANASRGPVTLGRFGFTSSAGTETSNSLEFGFKSTLMGGRARWNGAIYAMAIDDQQLTATGGVGNTNQLLNADRVNGYGIETDFEVLLTDNLLLIANASYNDTEIDHPGLKDDLCGSNPTCTGLDPVVGMRQGAFGPVTEVSIHGNPLPRAPDVIANLILNWSIPMSGGGELYFNTDWNYRSESNIFLHRSVEFVAESRVLGGVRAGYTTASESMDFAVVGRNITDEITVDGALNFLNLTAFINEPVFWGVEFRYMF